MGQRSNDSGGRLWRNCRRTKRRPYPWFHTERSSKLFQEIVKHDTPIYLALDPDAEKKSNRLIAALMKYDVELYKVDITGYDDVGSMTAEEYQKRKEAAMFMSSDNYLYYRALTAF